MSVVMFRKAAADLRWTTLWYIVGSAAYGLIMVAFYPTVEKNAADFQAMIERYPEALKKAFGISDFATLSGFLGGEFLNLIWPMIAAAFAVMAGSAVVAQEVERGTIELWLSVPCSRGRLLFAKLVALFTGATALVVSTVLLLALGAALLGKAFAVDHLAILGAVMLIFVIAVVSIAALLSVLFSARAPAAGIGAAIVIGSYLASVIPLMSDRWRWLEHVSLFTPYKPQQALATGSVSWLGLGLTAVVIIACTSAALILFSRRDAIA